MTPQHVFSILWLYTGINDSFFDAIDIYVRFRILMTKSNYSGYETVYVIMNMTGKQLLFNTCQ